MSRILTGAGERVKENAYHFAAVLGLAWVATHVRAVSSSVEAWSRLGSVYAIGDIASFWLIDRVIGFW